MGGLLLQCACWGQRTNCKRWFSAPCSWGLNSVRQIDAFTHPNSPASTFRELQFHMCAAGLSFMCALDGIQDFTQTPYQLRAPHQLKQKKLKQTKKNLSEVLELLVPNGRSPSNPFPLVSRSYVEEDTEGS